MRPSALVLLVLAVLAGFAPAAQAQQCGNLVRALSVDLEDHGSYFAVPLTINGTPRRYLLDTGGALTQISLDTIKAMGMTPQPSRFVMYDMYGNKNSGQIRADIGLGGQTIKNREMQVTGMGGLDGIFAADLMQNFDIDIDFAAKKLNYFLTDHCDGRVVYWPASVIASVPFHGWTINGDSHMNVTVKLDGHDVPAIIDTGASTSTLDADTARQLFDLTADSPGAVVKGTMAGTSRKVFGWTFKTLEIGSIVIRDPRLDVLPNLMGKGRGDREDIAADSHIQRITDGMQPTMLIGMETLRKLHLYIAFKERKLYLTAGSDQTTQRPAAAAPVAASTPAATGK